MHKHFVDHLLDPKTKDPFTLVDPVVQDGAIYEGKLVSGDVTIEIKNGIPIFAAEELTPDEQQVREFFSSLWNTIDVDHEVVEKEEFYLDGFKNTMLLDHLSDEEAKGALKKYFSGKKRILDAGCGVAWIAHYFRATEEQEWYCVDFGDSVQTAQKNLGANPQNFIAQASLYDLPFKENFFDLIICQGVLHHMPHPKEAFDVLVPLVEPGGELILGMIRKQPPVRDFVDVYSREQTTEMNFEEGKAFSKAMYLMAKELQSHDLTINVPPGLDVLGIESGEYSLHRFIHVNFMKCVYADGFSEDENIKHNMDWYTPKYAWAYTEEELISWYEEAGLTDIRCWKPKNLGEKNQMVRIHGKKPA